MALVLEQPTETKEAWEPRIVALFCNWCTYAAADLAGISRVKYAANMRIVRVMCSGRIDPSFVLEAFRDGADGVLIGGCNPGDCHYRRATTRRCAGLCFSPRCSSTWASRRSASAWSGSAPLVRANSR